MAVRGDNPIKLVSEDRLDRKDAAREFAEQVLSLDVSEGVVVGILGPWGSGKTSFLNMARTRMESRGAVVLDFNPWMFSGTEQLVDSFFIELAAQLKLRPGLGEVGAKLDEYGEVFTGLGWLPFVGAWIERGRLAGRTLGKLLQRRKEGISGRRDRLRRALIETGMKIVVVLDDIDRLTTDEIRDTFKLVRLIASFPNVIYVVAFDRARVEAALSEQHIPGRDYLEKILQLAVDLPAISPETLRRETFAALDKSVAGAEWYGDNDGPRWIDIYVEVVAPLISNMRDITRYAAAVQGVVPALNQRVALSDILGLEAVRVFRPDLFQQLHSAVATLTTTSSWHSREPEEVGAAVRKLVETAADERPVVEAMIHRLFPAAERHIGGSHYDASWSRTWLRERRVAHEDNLRFYLERVAGTSLSAFNAAESAWAVLDDLDAVTGILDDVPDDRIGDVVAGLENYEGDFEARHAVSGVTAVANQLGRLPDRDLGMFTMPPELTVTRVALRMLRALDNPEQAGEAMNKILPAVRTLNAKLALICLVGHQENVGHGLVSEPLADELEASWRSEVRATSADDLARESNLLRIALQMKRADRSEPAWQLPSDPSVTLALLRGSASLVRRQGSGSRAVQHSDRLAWDSMVQAVSGEDSLRERLAAARPLAPEADAALLDLADEYLAGWRPEGP